MPSPRGVPFGRTVLQAGRRGVLGGRDAVRMGWILLVIRVATYRDGFRYKLFKKKVEICCWFKRFRILCDA